MRRMYLHPDEYRNIFLAHYLCIGVVPGGMLSERLVAAARALMEIREKTLQDLKRLDEWLEVLNPAHNVTSQVRSMEVLQKLTRQCRGSSSQRKKAHKDKVPGP